MKAFFTHVILLVGITSVYAQRITPTFGTLSDGEPSLKAPENEPDADAVVIFDIGDSKFFSEGADGFVIRFTRTRRIKVLTRAGFRHAEVSIPYYQEDRNNTEKVEGPEAMTYNLENGHIIMRKLDPATVYDEQLSPKWRVKKFVLPDVKENTIIEYRYTVESPFFFNLPDWKFQSDVPTQYSEYSVGMTPFYEYDFIAQGIEKFDYQNSQPVFPKKSFGGIRYNDQVTTFALKNIPSFKDESFISSPEDYIMKIDLQLSKMNRLDGTYKEYRTTWLALNKSLLEHEDFGKYFNAARRLAKGILGKELASVAESPDGKKKHEAIIAFVRQQIQWNGINSQFTHRSPKDVFSQKTGNAAEINLLLAALLTEAGADAHLVILSTRDHGKIRKEYPFDHYFNYVLVFINGERPFLADGTENQLALDRIPARCINGQGLIVSKELENWVNLETKAPSVEDVNLTITLTPSTSSAQVTGTVQSTEYTALNLRKSFQNDTAKIREYLNDKLQLSAWKTSSINYEDPSRPYVITFKGTTPIETAGTKLIFTPFLDFPLRENPFLKEHRSFPVDFTYPRTSQLTCTLILPVNYQLEALPESQTMDNEMMKITYSGALRENVLTIQASYMLKKSVYTTTEYARLRTYFGIVARDFNRSLAIIKKQP